MDLDPCEFIADGGCTLAGRGVECKRQQRSAEIHSISSGRHPDPCESLSTAIVSISCDASVYCFLVEHCEQCQLVELRKQVVEYVQSLKAETLYTLQFGGDSVLARKLMRECLTALRLEEFQFDCTPVGDLFTITTKISAKQIVDLLPTLSANIKWNNMQ